MAAKIVEILQYRLKPTTGKDFHKIMREISIPLHVQHSIDVVAYGCSRHDIDHYYLIREFENEVRMKSVLDDFYASDDWQRGPREEIVSRIEASLKSTMLLSPGAVAAMRNCFQDAEKE
ncbi:NIPSNAP family protein [Pantoea sp. EA-12]|uniref:NIPSNAP family protein n=1 Tax=Pantoea sp. EA-12 TaxID=3043303 RepID=UPI0024B5A5BA|nr:NIPSNAP family protein [Pantoea sp. EA-12]MDI9220274.1 NIPSNAP family protein [Pantoea sp. EA-12]